MCQSLFFHFELENASWKSSSFYVTYETKSDKARHSEWATSTCASVVCGLFWVKGNQDPVGTTETFTALLNYLKEFKLGAWPTIRVKTRNDILLISMGGQTYLYWNLLSLRLPSKAPRCVTSSLAQSILCTHFPFLSLNLSCMWGLWVFHDTYICIKFGYFLLLICLMFIWLLDHWKELWG